MKLEPFFLPVDSSQRFCLLQRPSAAMEIRGTILYLHPFAEEMNRSRAVVARQARAFAAAGYVVLQIDLYGCGDSAGDFAAASWSQWQADALAGVAYLQARFAAPLCLWGLRSGALLVTEVARMVPTPAHLLLWQPVLSGRQHLQQFLRLGLANALLEGSAEASSETLMARLQAGQSVELAGYVVSPALAAGLAASELAPPHAAQSMHCIEILPGGGEITPALRRFVAQGDIQFSVCDAAQCWLTPGVLEAPLLETVSLQALAAMLP